MTTVYVLTCTDPENDTRVDGVYTDRAEALKHALATAHQMVAESADSDYPDETGHIHHTDLGERDVVYLHDTRWNIKGMDVHGS